MSRFRKVQRDLGPYQLMSKRGAMGKCVLDGISKSSGLMAGKDPCESPCKMDEPKMHRHEGADLSKGSDSYVLRSERTYQNLDGGKMTGL